MSETKTMNVRFQQKYDTAVNWENSTIVLLAGEIAVESNTGKFKFGNGEDLYKDLPYAGIDQAQLEAIEDNYTKLTPADGVTDTEALSGIANPSKGDIAVIERMIGGISTASTMTAYMYDGEKWCALDGNYDASNVYFDSDLVMTANIGVQTLGSGESSKNLNTSGKSLKQVMSMILAKEEKPSITSNPTVTTKIGNDATPDNSAISVEGGSTIKPKWSASMSAGAYKYGPATGLTPTAWSVVGKVGSGSSFANVEGHSSVEASGTFDDVVLAAGKSYKITATASHGEGPVAKTNLGEEYKAGNALFDETSNAAIVRIAAASPSDDSPLITAWQQGYYIGTLESDVEITSDILRAKDVNKVLKNRVVKGGNYAAATDLKFSPSGTMAKFVIAYPAAKDMTNGAYDSAKGLQSFFNNSSFEEYKGNFTRNVIKVAGADNDLTSSHAIDYAVWTWVPASAFSGSINFLIDLK